MFRVYVCAHRRQSFICVHPPRAGRVRARAAPRHGSCHFQTKLLCLHNRNRLKLHDSLGSEEDTAAPTHPETLLDTAPSHTADPLVGRHRSAIQVSQPTDPSFQAWRDLWKDATPQHAINAPNLPRDHWRCIDIPADSKTLAESKSSPAVQRILADAQQWNYWLYATGRSIYFAQSSFTSNLLQIRPVPNWRPWVAGRHLRTELAAALKRVAISSESKDIQDTATRIPNTAARVRKRFGSILELYRRDCSNIVCGIYRAPFDASLCHRQFNPIYVRDYFLRTLEANSETGERRARGRRGFLEARDAVWRRICSAGLKQPGHGGKL